MQVIVHKNYKSIRQFIEHIKEYETLTATLLSLDEHDYFIARCTKVPTQLAIYTDNRILAQLTRATTEDCCKIQQTENKFSTTVGCMYSTVNLEGQFMPGYLFYNER